MTSNVQIIVAMHATTYSKHISVCRELEDSERINIVQLQNEGAPLTQQCDVLLLDLEQNDALQNPLRLLFGDGPLVLIRREPHVTETIRAFCCEGIGAEAIRAAILNATGARNEDVDAKPFALSERDKQVLRMMAAGASNREIAQRLFISVSTVKQTISRMLQMFHASDRTQAAVIATRQNLI